MAGIKTISVIISTKKPQSRITIRVPIFEEIKNELCERQNFKKKVCWVKILILWSCLNSQGPRTQSGSF